MIRHRALSRKLSCCYFGMYKNVTVQTSQTVTSIERCCNGTSSVQFRQIIPWTDNTTVSYAQPVDLHLFLRNYGFNVLYAPNHLRQVVVPTAKDRWESLSEGSG